MIETNISQWANAGRIPTEDGDLGLVLREPRIFVSVWASKIHHFMHIDNCESMKKALSFLPGNIDGFGYVILSLTKQQF